MLNFTCLLDKVYPHYESIGFGDGSDEFDDISERIFEDLVLEPIKDKYGISLDIKYALEKTDSPIKFRITSIKNLLIGVPSGNNGTKWDYCNDLTWKNKDLNYVMNWLCLKNDVFDYAYGFNFENERRIVVCIPVKNTQFFIAK